jgi:hypothetical protein
LIFNGAYHLKINLGCGRDLRPGYINIDKDPRFSPDIVHDLEQFPWPFADGEVTEVVALHCLEHLGQTTDVFLKIIQELYRVMAPNAVMYVAVPHHRSDYFTGDPTHVRPITIALFTLLSKKNCQFWAEHGAANTPLADMLDVDFEIDTIELKLSQHWEQKRIDENMSREEMDLAITMYNNVVEEVRFVIHRV